MIVISNPSSLTDETKMVNEFFDLGLELFHLRKPGFTKEELLHFIEGIKQKHHHKIVLHQHYDLSGDFDINRIHFTGKTRPESDIIMNGLNSQKEWVFSTSTHNIEVFNSLPAVYEYAFLSPVYNSISKPGYTSDTDIIMSVKERNNFKTKLVALGGIDKNNYKKTLHFGFDDTAFLGAIWGAKDPVKEFKQVNNEK